MQPSDVRSPKVLDTAAPMSGLFSVHLIPLLLLTLIFFLNFAARISLSPLAPEIEASLNLTHLQAGSLFLIISLGYFTGLLGAGWLAAPGMTASLQLRWRAVQVILADRRAVYKHDTVVDRSAGEVQILLKELSERR